MNYQINQKTDENVVILDGAVVRGDVRIGAGSSVWFNAVVRAEEEKIVIGQNTNVQDCAVLHVDPGMPLIIGDNVTIGHGAIVHACTVGSNTLIGMGAIVLNGARIGKNCIVGAGSLVTGNTVIPDGWMAFGNPAKPVRKLKEAEIAQNLESARHYAALKESYRK